MAVPPYPGSEQAWGSYENWPVWLCEHRVKVLSISTRSHFSIKNCYRSLYRRTRALNSKMVVIENDQYDCATIVSNFQPILRGRTFSDEKRVAVPPYPGSEQAWASYENWPVWLREHRVKVLSISMRSHFSIKIFEKRGGCTAVPRLWTGMG